MFSDTAKNINMIKGAYRKLKSYYYYNKNFILMRKKIAEFEYDHVKMETIFLKMADAIQHPNSIASKAYLGSLIDHIKFFVLPKKFESQTIRDDHPVSNTIQRNKKMKTVNFFIDAPIEIYIFDTLWTVLVAKMDYDKKVLSHDIYGNTINKSALFGAGDICFENRVLFNIYFSNYCNWRNNAFRSMEKSYDLKKDSVLISLDIKSYFYSIDFSFKQLHDYFPDHELLSRITPLTVFLEKVYAQYYQIIKPYRKDLSHLPKKKYPLPIGLFSSMLLSNLFLYDFDKKIRTIDGVQYYGRYVDDILIVANKTISKETSNQSIIDDLLIKTGILKKEKDVYSFVGYRSLFVQSDKVKIIYIDHTESRALIDIYNDTIRVIPSQMDPLPNSHLNIIDFDETAYNIENFTKENKIRDIGLLGIDSFKVARFFSLLPRRYSNINITGDNVRKEIDHQIFQIRNFFAGSQTIEYYSNWLNYMYFLVITRRNTQLKEFYSTAKKQIRSIVYTSLDISVFSKVRSINKILKETLEQHLEICLCLALSIDIDITKHFRSHYNTVKQYIESNMFDHSYVALPLANYLEYSDYISFSKMEISDLGEYPHNIVESYKFIWSPRFIHYDELLLLLFYHYHMNNKDGITFKYVSEKLTEKFSLINHLGYLPFKIRTHDIYKNNDYLLESIDFPSADFDPPDKINVAVGSIDITERMCIQGCDRWTILTMEQKEMFFDILLEAHHCFIKEKKGPTIFVLPELCFPIYWINDLIRFVKRAQIAIVTGLRYLGDSSNQKYNYLATILPFTSGQKGYKNAFIHIREKNDYSPLEFEGLAKEGYFCRNKNIADYQVFNWNGICLTSIVCFELTDIMARAILKSNIDIIAASVFNPDTTYFSNIIDSTARDLHAFIIQANTSHLGDSRVTGPYDRDNKDIFKIKGGDNDHVVIGSIQFKKIKDYQKRYYINQENKLKLIEEERKKKTPNFPKKERKKPDIKRLPARFKLNTN